MKDALAISIINLPHRTDRRAECDAVMAQAGFKASEFDYFAAKHVPECGFMGCALSHAMALSSFLFHDDREHVLVLEDDVAIHHPSGFRHNLSMLLEQSAAFDVCLLAHDAAWPFENTPIGGVKRVYGAHTLAAYIVTRAMAPQLIECFFESAERIRQHKPKLDGSDIRVVKPVYAPDVMWKALQARHRFWATIPALCGQRPSYSDIEQSPV